jgi:hypothetical protein
MSRGPIRRALLLTAVSLTALLPILVAVEVVVRPGPRSGAVIEPFLLSLVALAVVSSAVGAAILWRKSGNRIGMLLLTGALLLTSVAASWWGLLTQVGVTSTGALSTTLTWWAVVAILPAVFLLFPTVGVFFPDGNLPDPGWRFPYALASAALLVGLVLQTVAPTTTGGDSEGFPSPFGIAGMPAVVGDIGGMLAIAAVLIAFVIALGSVAVRFRRSAGVERAQVKWLVAAVVLNSVLFPISYFTELGPDGLLDVVSVLAGSFIPIAIGIAVLRYRLYDIDRLISRTVSWALVTAGVVTVFALLVVGLQAALAGFTQGETLAVALSTIVAAGLFQPVRRRVQLGVDRRFDRARYDGELTAAAFAERLRHDADLDSLMGELRTTVGVAVRPATATIWLVDRGPAMTASAVTIPGHSIPNVTPI